MPKVILFEADIRRDDGQSISRQQHEKIVRKIVSLLKRLGCTIHGEWRLGDPPEVEDLLG